MAFTLEDSYNTGDNSATVCDNSNWYGQTFTTTSTYTATRVKLKVYKTANTGTININLYATSAGKPTGASIAHASADSSSFDVITGSFFAFDLDSSVVLSNATMYAVVVEPVAAGGTEAGFRRHVSGAYGGGTGLFSGNQGSSWSTLATSDFMFEIYSGSASTVYAEGTKTVTVVAVVSLSTDLTVRVEGTKTVTIAVTVSLASENYISQSGFPTPRPSDLDPDLYWDEDAGAWSSTRTTIPGNWVQNMLAISEEGEIYFRTL